MLDLIHPTELSRPMPEACSSESAEYTKTARAVAFASALDTVVLPGLALILLNIVLYSGLVSMELRATNYTRLFGMTIAFFAGVALGGVVTGRLIAVGNARRSVLGRVGLALLLGVSAATVLPGFFPYITNEPLRFVSAFSHFLLVAPTYYLFLSRFPTAWRGRCFGLSWCLGVLCWIVLSALAKDQPSVGATGTYHPLQPTIYLVYASSIVLLSCICIWCLVIRNDVPARSAMSGPLYFPEGNADANRLILFLTAVPGVMFFLNGLLGARLASSFFPHANTTLYYLSCAVTAGIAPLAGWLMDRNPRILSRWILPLCCGLFLFTPSLLLGGTVHHIYDILQPSVLAAQYIIYSLCSVAVAGVAGDARRGTILATRIFLTGTFHPLALILCGPILALGGGVSALTTTIASCVMLALAWKIRLTTAPLEQAAADAVPQCVPNVEPQNIIVVHVDPIAAFLDSTELTPREREIATLLLQGKTTLDMAWSLDITERTVKKHCTNIFRKYGVANARAFYARCFAHASGETEAVDEGISEDHP